MGVSLEMGALGAHTANQLILALPIFVAKTKATTKSICVHLLWKTKPKNDVAR